MTPATGLRAATTASLSNELKSGKSSCAPSELADDGYAWTDLRALLAKDFTHPPERGFAFDVTHPSEGLGRFNLPLRAFAQPASLPSLPRGVATDRSFIEAHPDGGSTPRRRDA